MMLSSNYFEFLKYPRHKQCVISIVQMGRTPHTWGHWCSARLNNLPSVQFSSGVSESLWPHGPQHARPPCPSPTRGVYPNSYQLRQWCHPTTSSSVIPFSSHLQSFPASGSFPISQFFAWGGQSIGVSASAWVLPVNIQDWFPLGWTGCTSQLTGLPGVTPLKTAEWESDWVLLNRKMAIHLMTELGSFVFSSLTYNAKDIPSDSWIVNLSWIGFSFLFQLNFKMI